jgi:hypothetical protein
MIKALRIIVGVSLLGLFLHLASLATRDCTIGVFLYDNCLWLWLRDRLGLPASKILRSGFLELVGLALLAGIYLTFRYVLPPWKADASRSDKGSLR